MNATRCGLCPQTPASFQAPPPWRAGVGMWKVIVDRNNLNRPRVRDDAARHPLGFKARGEIGQSPRTFEQPTWATPANPGDARIEEWESIQVRSDEKIIDRTRVFIEEGWGGGGEGTVASTCEPRHIATRRPLTLPSPLSTGERACAYNPPMPGEFEFIQWLRPAANRKRFLCECRSATTLAVLNWNGADLLLVGVDQVLDGVHFDSAAIHPPPCAHRPQGDEPQSLRLRGDGLPPRSGRCHGSASHGNES